MPRYNNHRPREITIPLGGSSHSKDKQRFSICSWNIQKSSTFSQIVELALSYDVLLIQEFKSSSNNLHAITQLTRNLPLSFHHSSPVDYVHSTTGIFINTKSSSIISSNELSNTIPNEYSFNDVRIRIPSGDHVLLVNVYLPSGDKTAHSRILRAIDNNYQQFKHSCGGLKLFMGGDWNHSYDYPTSQETQPVRTLKLLEQRHGIIDVAKLHHEIIHNPTNHASNQNFSTLNRRIDRFHLPLSWKHQATLYSLKTGPTKSTHLTITIQFHFSRKENHIHHAPRFKYPIQRLQMTQIATRLAEIHPRETITSALRRIRDDGFHFIHFMNFLRIHHPKFLDTQDDHQRTSSSPFNHTTKAFFHPETYMEPPVFQHLTDEAGGYSASTPSEMLKTATSYYKKLYQLPTEPDPPTLRRYLSGITQRLDKTQCKRLDQPFTLKELTRALKQSDHSSSPGPDGIQFPVISAYWSQIGPILCKSANQIMVTGLLPNCFKDVLITLIPKRNTGTSTDIKDLRPILLSNTTLKIISTAAANRIQGVIEHLVGPLQRGFIRNRLINHNTMEFFTLTDLLSSSRDVPLDPHSAIFMADFTKAFDRISHSFIRSVLAKMGFGSNFIRLLLLILQNQIARIMINNFQGKAFPILCGTRQGNPLSPLLFNLALEPFLCHVNKRVQGIPLCYKQIPISMIKYHAFADDINFYLADLADYATVAEQVRTYESLSNSKLNPAKSKLIGFSPEFSELSQSILPVTSTYILQEKEVSYLGLPLRGVNWAKFRASMPYIHSKQGYQQLPLISRAKATNTFISSKMVYKDLVQCMTAKELSIMDKAIAAAFPDIGTTKLYARPQKGGYGVIELSRQLQGHRGHVVSTVFHPNPTWWTSYFRLKLYLYMLRTILKKNHSDITLIGGLDLSDFLFSKDDNWYRPASLRRTFTSSECEYLRAWHLIVEGNRPATIRRPAQISKDSIRALIQTPPTLTELERQSIHPKHFKSLSRKHQASLEVIIPRRLTQLSDPAPSSSRWSRFWITMHRLEWKCKYNLEALHHFNFGLLVPVHDNPNSSNYTRCSLCSYFIPEYDIERHLYSQCKCTQYWWSQLGRDTLLSLDELLAPTDLNPPHLNNLNQLVSTIYHVFKQEARRLTQSVDPPSQHLWQTWWSQNTFRSR